MLLQARIRIIGVNPYVLVEATQASELTSDWRGPMPVRFRIAGKSDSLWRVNLMPVGDGTFRLYLHGGIRRSSGVGVGDMVTMDLLFDDEYRGGPQHPVPSWFDQELERNTSAMLGWKRLSPSRQKEILRYFARLKSDEAKQRNLKRAVYVLAGGKARFMGRLWNEVQI